MHDFTNRTFDEIAVGATESVTRMLTATDVEALALAAGDVEGFHIEGGPRSTGCRRRARRRSRWSPGCSTGGCRGRAAASSARRCTTRAPPTSATG